MRVDAYGRALSLSLSLPPLRRVQGDTHARTQRHPPVYIYGTSPDSLATPRHRRASAIPSGVFPLPPTWRRFPANGRAEVLDRPRRVTRGRRFLLPRLFKIWRRRKWTRDGVFCSTNLVRGHCFEWNFYSHDLDHNEYKLEIHRS